MMKRMVVLVILASILVHGAIVNIYEKQIPCIDHQNENVTSQKEEDTKEMIKKEEDAIKKAIDDYKEALEKKKEMMTKLWKATASIESLMKQNQLLRKEIIKHWEGVKQSQSVSK